MNIHRPASLMLAVCQNLVSNTLVNILFGVSENINLQNMTTMFNKSNDGDDGCFF